MGIRGGAAWGGDGISRGNGTKEKRVKKYIYRKWQQDMDKEEMLLQRGSETKDFHLQTEYLHIQNTACTKFGNMVSQTYRASDVRDTIYKNKENK